MIPKRIVPTRHGDARGWFMESYSRRRLAEQGVDMEFVQDNHSYSAQRGTLRGIHFQTAPHAQAKLVRCLAGAIWDVVVDLRAGSPTYGRWVAAELTAAGGEQMFVPIGFGHGFVTLTDDTEVAYKASDYYAPQAETGVVWNDPDLGIEWPLGALEPVLSAKDQALPRLADFVSPFAYEGEPLTGLDGT
jgi:dTDP-4-dehydrorhamnose 3,5-epimerase